ncbi:acyl-CoA carboxylase subunit beta, partial [Marinactinospora rubrisoli]
PRVPHHRLTRLLDPATATPTSPRDDAGVHTAHGRINGHPVTAYCTDATRMGGALGTEGCRRIAHAIDTAAAHGHPVIGIWHSGGARIAEGVEALHAVGQVFAAIVRASGRVPQISIVVGPAAGGAAYGPALTDIVVMTPTARIFVTGPDVVRSVTGEHTDQNHLGGPDAHTRRSGVAHVLATGETDAYTRARHLATLLAAPGTCAPHTLHGEPPRPDPRTLLPDRPQRAYDIRPLARALLDTHPDGTTTLEELQPRWAPNIVTALGRLAGGTVGVIANNPLRKGGCLDALSAEKAARFVRMCDAFGIPLTVLVDVPGYLPGVHQEWDGVVRRGAKLLHAFAEATVPRATLILRKSYGGAYIAMNSRSLGATTVLAWPGAEIAVMGARAAVDLLHRKTLAATPDHQRDALRTHLTAQHQHRTGGLQRAHTIGVIDDIIDPAHTRHRLAHALATAPARRGAHNNIPL